MTPLPFQKQINSVINQPKESIDLGSIRGECAKIATATLISIILFIIFANNQSLVIPQIKTLAQIDVSIANVRLHADASVPSSSKTYVSFEQLVLSCFFLVGWLPTLLIFRREADDDDAIDGNSTLPRVRWPAQLTMSLLMGLLLVIIPLIWLRWFRTDNANVDELPVFGLAVLFVCSWLGAASVAYIMMFAKRLLWLILLGAGLFGGVLSAALLANDSNWFSHSISFLGSLPSSYQIFTASISIVGIALLVFAQDILYDLTVLNNKGPWKAPRLDYLRLAFSLIGLGLVGVAFFPIETHPLLTTLHLISAWGMATVAVLLMVAMPWLVPGKKLVWLHISSIATALICGVIFGIWALVGKFDGRYFTLVEILFGIFTILWLLSVQITTSYFIHTEITEVANESQVAPPAAA